MWGAKDLSGGYGEGGDELSGSDFGQDDGQYGRHDCRYLDNRRRNDVGQRRHRR